MGSCDSFEDSEKKFSTIGVLDREQGFEFPLLTYCFFQCQEPWHDIQPSSPLVIGRAETCDHQSGTFSWVLFTFACSYQLVMTEPTQRFHHVLVARFPAFFYRLLHLSRHRVVWSASSKTFFSSFAELAKRESSSATILVGLATESSSKFVNWSLIRVLYAEVELQLIFSGFVELLWTRQRDRNYNRTCI